MRRPRLLSWTGVAFAALYGVAYVALYLVYLQNAGAWLADLPLALAALPFTLTMRALAGGSFDFSGDMSARVVAGGLFGCALAYLVGWALEALIRAGVRTVRRG